MDRRDFLKAAGIAAAAPAIGEAALKNIRDRLKERLFAWYNPEDNPYRAV